METALVCEDVAERMEGACVASVTRDGGLHDEARAYEVERGEEDAC